MNILEALNWRYATKRMNGNSIPQDQLDTILKAISLAPSSYGLQPYTIFVITNKELLAKLKPIASMQPQITEASAILVFAAWENVTQEKIDAFVALNASVRGGTIESFNPLKMMIEPQLKQSNDENFNWNAKQAYLALGIGLLAAAELNVDSTPMEGFNHNQLDELLHLKEKGLKSVVLLALGYRDLKLDYLVRLKKVRRPGEDLFIMLD